MSARIRRQLTLFVAPDDAEAIEHIRKTYNPQQHERINSHVTLCREDEIEAIEQVLFNLSNLKRIALTLEFEQAIRFDAGKGVLLPAKNGTTEFQELRKQALRGLHKTPRKQEPHITLMHPRNATCTDAIFEEISSVKLPHVLTFNRISLIEQRDGGAWNVLKEFEGRN